MKRTRFLQLLLIICLLFLGFGCSQGGNKPDPELTPAERAEAAMDNFIRKLQAGNYQITGGQSAAINVVSPELVMFQYPHGLDPFSYVFMSLKGETFATVLYDSDRHIDDVEFVSTDDAIKVNGTLLPNGWIDLCGGEMFSRFYNNVDNPLEFTSYDEEIKLSLLSMAGYSERAMRVMEEAHVLLDNDDPSVVRLTAVVHDDEVARIKYKDIDLTLTFGAGKSDSRIDSWLKDPVYPAIRTGWTRDDLETHDLTFFRNYGQKAVPFPQTSSHAMILDPDAYKLYTGFRLLDHNLSEKDVEDYKLLLLSEGFEEGQGSSFAGQNVTVYRRVLREERNAWVQLYPAYDDGFVLEGKLDYRCPEFEGLEAISAEVQKHGFAPLEQTDVFGDWKAIDVAGPQTEGWVYYFDFDFYGGIQLTFEDRQAARAYLSKYADSLLKQGFIESFIPGEDNRCVTSANSFTSFSYKFSEEQENAVSLEFKNQRALSVEQVRELLQEHGLPDVDIHGDIGAREVSRYYYEIAGFEGLRLTVYQPYPSRQAAEKYLDSLIPVLEEQGYYMFNPEKIGSQRQFVYFNEEARKYVGFDIIPSEKDAQIFYEIVSFESPLESIMESKLGLSR